MVGLKLTRVCKKCLYLSDFILVKYLITRTFNYQSIKATVVWRHLFAVRAFVNIGNSIFKQEIVWLWLQFHWNYYHKYMNILDVMIWKHFHRSSVVYPHKALFRRETLVLLLLSAGISCKTNGPVVCDLRCSDTTISNKIISLKFPRSPF